MYNKIITLSDKLYQENIKTMHICFGLLISLYLLLFILSAISIIEYYLIINNSCDYDKTPIFKNKILVNISDCIYSNIHIYYPFINTFYNCCDICFKTYKDSFILSMSIIYLCLFISICIIIFAINKYIKYYKNSNNIEINAINNNLV